MNTPDQATYCDNCADLIQSQTLWVYNAVPWDTASANAGESACLCGDCVKDLTERAKARNIVSTNQRNG